MKKALLCTVSAITLTTGLSAGAMAFDKVDWDWQLDAETKVDVKVDVDIYVDPNGAAIVEIDQDFKGDLDAKATVVGVFNDPADGGGHKWNWNDDGLDAATELPSIENVAAAIGNVASIESEWSVQAHIDQDVQGDSGYYGSSPADIDADATVLFVLNSSVENTAQAIGNSASITLDPATADEAFLMADISQSAHMNGSATATVGGVFVEGYSGLGETVLVDNTAIAVGNIANVTVVNGVLDD